MMILEDQDDTDRYSKKFHIPHLHNNKFHSTGLLVLIRSRLLQQPGLFSLAVYCFVVFSIFLLVAPYIPGHQHQVVLSNSLSPLIKPLNFSLLLQNKK